MPSRSSVSEKEQNSWTPKKDAFLMRHGQSMTRQELAKNLKTTVGSVTWRLIVLGIRKVRQPKTSVPVYDAIYENTNRQKLIDANTAFEQVYAKWAKKHGMRVWDYRKAPDQ